MKQSIQAWRFEKLPDFGATLTQMLFLLTAISFSASAFAETIDEYLHNPQTEADGSLPTSAVAPAANGRKIDEIWIGMDEESFLDRTHPPAAIRDYNFLSGRLRSRSVDHLINGAIDVGGAFATSVENYTFVEMPEAYLSWKNEPGDLEITVGRRREEWSMLDEDWSLGLWQPVNNFDSLHPTEQGLSGIFASWTSELVRATGFVSPLFIPSQGAPYQLSNGTFATNSPWFSKPPSAVELFPGEPDSRLNFELQTPSTGSVINKLSIGLMLELGAKERAEAGAFLRASFIRKPRNSLATPFETTYVLADTESYGNVVIFPRVEFHRLEALEFGYRTRSYAVGVSSLRDDPENQGAPVDAHGDSSRMSYQNISQATYVSPYVEWRAWPERAWSPRIRLMGLNTIDGQTQAQGLLSNSTSLFGYRALYRRAFSLQEDSMLWQSHSWRLDQSLRWIEETAELGSVVSANLRLSYTESWCFALAADLIGSRQPDNDTGTFIARFRDNDNVSAHLTYVF